MLLGAAFDGQIVPSMEMVRLNPRTEGRAVGREDCSSVGGLACSAAVDSDRSSGVQETLNSLLIPWVSSR